MYLNPSQVVNWTQTLIQILRLYPIYWPHYQHVFFMFLLFLWIYYRLCDVLLGKYTLCGFINVYVTHVLANFVLCAKNSWCEILSLNSFLKVYHWRSFIHISLDSFYWNSGFSVHIYQLKNYFFLSLPVNFKSKKEIVFNFCLETFSFIIWQYSRDDNFRKILFQSVHFNPDTHLIKVVKMTFN